MIWIIYVFSPDLCPCLTTQFAMKVETTKTWDKLEHFSSQSHNWNSCSWQLNKKKKSWIWFFDLKHNLFNNDTQTAKTSGLISLRLSLSAKGAKAGIRKSKRLTNDHPPHFNSQILKSCLHYFLSAHDHSFRWSNFCCWRVFLIDINHRIWGMYIQDIKICGPKNLNI